MHVIVVQVGPVFVAAFPAFFAAERARRGRPPARSPRRSDKTASTTAFPHRPAASPCAHRRRDALQDANCRTRRLLSCAGKQSIETLAEIIPAPGTPRRAPSVSPRGAARPIHGSSGSMPPSGSRSVRRNLHGRGFAGSQMERGMRRHLCASQRSGFTASVIAVNQIFVESVLYVGHGSR